MKNGRDTAINELQQFWTATGQMLQKCFLRSNPRGLTWWSMVKSLRFYCREHRLHPWLGSWVPACHSEIKKKKKVHLYKICLQWKRPWFDSWVRKIPWKRDRLPTPVLLGFSGDSDGKESAFNSGNSGLIPELGRSSGEGNGYHSTILAWRIS